MSNQPTPVRYGIDMLLSGLVNALQGKRMGMVTNDAATTGVAYSRLTPSRLAMQRAGIPPVLLFAPEHGIGSAAVDGAPIEDEVAASTATAFAPQRSNWPISICSSSISPMWAYASTPTFGRSRT